MSEVSIPPAYTMHNPTIQALHKLGGSGTNAEIHDEVVAILGLTDEQIQKPYTEGSNKRAVFERLAWVKTQLKRYGLLENSSRGVWSLTKEGLATTEVDGKEVERVAHKIVKQEKKAKEEQDSLDSGDSDETLPESDNPILDVEWRDQLYPMLTNMDPTAFERLCQRILRESGFTKVDVTQASHDGGIDGKGILQVNDFLSFRVVFQCKRYSGSVGPDVVQKLRGAMPGSADRGLIVTTGHFTQGAIKEASHEHKSPIELVDGEELLNRLKALELGVSTEMVEKVTVDPDFFANI